VVTEGPRFREGAKVRIRTRRASGQFFFDRSDEHEDRLGVVLSSTAVVAYAVPLRTVQQDSDPSSTVTLFLYAVKLEEGIIVHDLNEHLLEQVSSI
jgi:hypothetical protein